MEKICIFDFGVNCPFKVSIWYFLSLFRYVLGKIAICIPEIVVKLSVTVALVAVFHDNDSVLFSAFPELLQSGQRQQRRRSRG